MVKNMILDGIRTKIQHGTMDQEVQYTGRAFVNLNNFNNDKVQQKVFAEKGSVINNNSSSKEMMHNSYYVEKIDVLDENNQYQDIINYKKQIENLPIDNESQNVNSTDKQVASMYTAAQLDDRQYLQELLDNAAESNTFGTYMYSMPNTARLLNAPIFKQEAERGTRYGDKVYGIKDYINVEHLNGFDFATNIAYILERDPSQILSPEDFEAVFSDIDADSVPSSIGINYNKDFEVRSIKNTSLSATITTNLYQDQAKMAQLGFNQRALKEQYVINWFKDIVYYKTMMSMFSTKNPIWQEEKIANDPTGTNIPENNSLLQRLGMVSSAKKQLFSLPELIYQDVKVITQFIISFSQYIRYEYGNNTMKQAVLVVSDDAFTALNTPWLPHCQNQSIFAGFMSPRFAIENLCNCIIVPSNLFNGRHANIFKQLNIAQADKDVFCIYDKAQFFMYITREFKSLSQGWHTANGVDFVQVFEGQMTDVFNPYYNPSLTTNNIPAVKCITDAKTITI